MLTWWSAATEKAQVIDAHFHDIRGKAATGGKRVGLDYQALLGHSTKAMSDRYIKLEDAQIVIAMQKNHSADCSQLLMMKTFQRLNLVAHRLETRKT